MAAGIDNVTIDNLAKAIGINNKLDTLGLKLGYSFADMKMFKAKNYAGGDVTWHGTRDMLVDWSTNSTPREQQRGKLKKALEDAGLGGLAEQFLGDEVPTMKSEEVDRPEPQKVQTHLEKQPGSHTNTINASGSSKVLGNTMIGEQTNVFNQSAPTPSVVHHHNTTVMQQPPRSIPVPVYIHRSTASKRASTVAQGPAPKRQKVTQSSQSRPSTSKQTVAKPKKVPSQRKTAPKQKSTKQKSQKAPKAPQKKAPKKTATKKTPTAPKKKAPKKTATKKTPTAPKKKTPQKKPKKPPKSKQPKSQKPKGTKSVRPRSKPKKSKKK